MTTQGSRLPLLGVSINEYEKEKRRWFENFNKAVDSGNEDACRKILDENKFDVNENEDGKFFHPLLRAAQKGNFNIMRLLLEKKAYVLAKDKKYWTALHYSIQNHSLQCTDLLLQRSISLLTCRDKNGFFPIHTAAAEGDVNIMKKLLEIYEELSLSPDEKNNNLETPLHLAASGKHVEVLQILLDNKAQWNCKDKDGRLPLHFAAFNNAKDCCLALLKASQKNLKAHLNHTNNNSQTPLILAAMNGHYEICEILNGTDVNHHDNKGYTALHYAADKGNVLTTEILLKLKPAELKKTMKDKNTPMHILAIKYQYTNDSDKPFYFECLEKLVDYFSEIDPGLNADNKSVLYLAAKNNWLSAVEFLLSKEIYSKYLNDRDTNGSTILHCDLDTKILKLLLTREDIIKNVANKNGEVPLHLAANRGNNDNCRLLLTLESVKHRNNSGRIPLHLAAMNGFVECCNTLEKEGKGITTRDYDNFTPLHYAAIYGHTEVLKFFTKKKKGFIYEVNETTGDTVLHLAAREGHTECCLFILKKMNNDLIHSVNKYNKTALDEAFLKKHDETYKEILSYLKALSLPNEESYHRLQYQLHTQLKETLQEEAGARRKIQEAIVDSEWWISAFSSVYCSEGQCPNLTNLIKSNPVEAEKVFSKCVSKSNDFQVFDFTLFEDSYYLPIEKVHLGIQYQKRLSPFDPSSGKLFQKGVETFAAQNPHPLVASINNGRLRLLNHPLSKAYLDYKWTKYIGRLLFGFVLFEIITVICISLFLHHIWHFEYLSLLKNVSREEVCLRQDFNRTIVTEEDSDGPLIFLTVLLSLIFIVSVAFEVKFLVRTRDCFFTWAFCVRILRIVGLFILLVPMSGCQNHLIRIREDWQWTVGIWTLLLSWFYMIHTINEIPAISLFMPVTLHFIFSFLRVLFLILLLIMIYAIIFYLLLPKSNAFKSLEISFVKTIVWALGDLAYDDTFLDEESPIPHPLLTNILFILLVTSISGLIINLFISKPDDILEYFRVRANFHKIASRTQTILKLDNLSQTLKKKYTVQRWEKYILTENNFKRISEKVLRNLECSYNYTKDEELSCEDKLVNKLDSVLEELKKQNDEQKSINESYKVVLEKLEDLAKEQETLKKFMENLNKKPSFK